MPGTFGKSRSPELPLRGISSTQELKLLRAGDRNLAAPFDYDPHPQKWKNDEQRVLFAHNLKEA